MAVSRDAGCAGLEPSRANGWRSTFGVIGSEHGGGWTSGSRQNPEEHRQQRSLRGGEGESGQGKANCRGESSGRNRKCQ